MVHHDDNKFDVSDKDSIVDRMIVERCDIRVRFNTMIIIENLPITKAYNIRYEPDLCVGKTLSEGFHMHKNRTLNS